MEALSYLLNGNATPQIDGMIGILIMQDSDTNRYTADSGLCFSESLADYVGIIPAIVYENIRYWVNKNRKKGTTSRHGKTWTYQGVREMAEQIKGITQKQVRAGLKKLEEYGLILAGFFGGCDRRLWYTIAAQNHCEKAAEQDKRREPEKLEKQATAPVVAHLPIPANPFSQMGKCLHIQTQIKQTTYNPPVRSGRSDAQSNFDLSENLPLIQKNLEDEHGKLNPADETWLQAKLTELLDRIGKTRLTLSWSLTMISSDYSIRLQSSRRTAMIAQQRDRLAAATAAKIRAQAEKAERDAKKINTQNPYQEKRQPETDELMSKDWATRYDFDFDEDSPILPGGRAYPVEAAS